MNFYTYLDNFNRQNYLLRAFILCVGIISLKSLFSQTKFEINNASKINPRSLNFFQNESDSARINYFTLIDASTDTSIRILSDGDVLNLDFLPPKLSVRANVDRRYQVIESVVFDLNGIKGFKIENFEPYSLGGDSDGNFAPIAVSVGDYSLTAVPYSAQDGKGAKGIGLSIKVRVIRSTSKHPPTLSYTTDDLYCRGDSVIIKPTVSDADGDELVYSLIPRSGFLPDNILLNPYTGEITGVLVRTGDEGTSTGYSVDVKVTDASGLSSTATVNIFSISCGSRVTSFTLVDALSQKDILSFLPGKTYNVKTLPVKANIRANVYFDEWASENDEKYVIFGFNGKNNYRTEKSAPYALGGDINGIYNPVPFAKGANKITATPSLASEKSFTVTINLGASQPVTAKRINGTTLETSQVPLYHNPSIPIDKLIVYAYPNPFRNHLSLALKTSLGNTIQANLYNSAGTLVYSQLIKLNEGKQVLRLNGINVTKGTYYLKIISDNQLSSEAIKVVRE